MLSLFIELQLRLCSPSFCRPPWKLSFNSKEPHSPSLRRCMIRIGMCGSQRLSIGLGFCCRNYLDPQRFGVSQSLRQEPMWSELCYNLTYLHQRYVTVPTPATPPPPPPCIKSTKPLSSSPTSCESGFSCASVSDRSLDMGLHFVVVGLRLSLGFFETYEYRYSNIGRHVLTMTPALFPPSNMVKSILTAPASSVHLVFAVSHFLPTAVITTTTPAHRHLLPCSS